METLIDILIIVALLAAAGLCVYLIITLSKVNAVLDEAKTLTQSLKPVVANLQSVSNRIAPLIDTVEGIIRKVQPIMDNLAGISASVQDIAGKVDRQIDQVLFALNDAARLVQDVIRLIDDVRAQIVAPITGIAGLVSTAYKTVSSLISGVSSGTDGQAVSQQAVSRQTASSDIPC